MKVLDINGEAICSGVLVAPTLVLTAGECAAGAVIVVVGDEVLMVCHKNI